MATSKMEFMVENITDKELLKQSLAKEPGITRVEIIGSDAVVIESTLSCDKATDILQQQTGGNAILWGLGEGTAAVAVMEGNGVQGVVRFGGISKSNGGLVDGTLDGLPPGKHSLQIHTAGDLSRGCESLGPILQPIGKLGDINVESSGRANFKFIVPELKISDIVGRSLAVAEENDKIRFACGVIARSAGLFQNNKRICACDGITLWDEKYVPVTGQSRRKFADSKQR